MREPGGAGIGEKAKEKKMEGEEVEEYLKKRRSVNLLYHAQEKKFDKGGGKRKKAPGK